MSKAKDTSVWDDDLLNRKDDADYLIQFVIGMALHRKSRGQPASYVLNIDSAWGTGKTFFLDRLRRDLGSRGHPVAFVNAWKDDRAEDPLIAVMAHIEDAIFPSGTGSKARKEAWRLTKKSGVQIVTKVGSGLFSTMFKRYVGHAAEELFEELYENENIDFQSEINNVENEIDILFDNFSEAIIKEYRNKNDSVESFKKNLARSITKQRKTQNEIFLFVLIDELDRCRPTYAISLLERVKHLFQVDNVIFFIATDTEQLQHSIRGAYGGEFNGRQYLKRFFDQTYVFPEPSWPQFISLHCQLLDKTKINHPDESLQDFLLSVTRVWQPDFRSMLQWLEHCQAVIASWDRTFPIQLHLLLPSVIRFHQTGNPDFYRDGEDWPVKNKKMWKTTAKLKSKPHQGGYESASIYDIYRNTISSINNPEITLQRTPAQEYEWQYVFKQISEEFNGVAMGPVSAQTRIPALVRSAGQLKNIRGER